MDHCTFLGNCPPTPPEMYNDPERQYPPIATETFCIPSKKRTFSWGTNTENPECLTQVHLASSDSQSESRISLILTALKKWSKAISSERRSHPKYCISPTWPFSSPMTFKNIFQKMAYFSWIFAPLGRYVDQHIDRYIGRYVDCHTTDISVDI